MPRSSSAVLAALPLAGAEWEGAADRRTGSAGSGGGSRALDATAAPDAARRRTGTPGCSLAVAAPARQQPRPTTPTSTSGGPACPAGPAGRAPGRDYRADVRRRTRRLRQWPVWSSSAQPEHPIRPDGRWHVRPLAVWRRGEALRRVQPRGRRAAPRGRESVSGLVPRNWPPGACSTPCWDHLDVRAPTRSASSSVVAATTPKPKRLIKAMLTDPSVADHPSDDARQPAPGCAGPCARLEVALRRDASRPARNRSAHPRRSRGALWSRDVIRYRTLEEFS